VDIDEKQSSLEGDVYGAAGRSRGESKLAVDTNEKQSSLKEDFLWRCGDREWKSQMALDTDEKRSSFEGDVNGAAMGSTLGESVGREQR